MTLEESIARINEIVEKLEAGVPFEESVALYKEGMKLIGASGEKIAAAEKAMEKAAADGE